jgi:hypothetical protein
MVRQVLLMGVYSVSGILSYFNLSPYTSILSLGVVVSKCKSRFLKGVLFVIDFVAGVDVSRTINFRNVVI